MKLQELLIEMAVRKKRDGAYTSKDRKIIINLDMDDPEEREGSIWFKVKTEDEIEALIDSHQEWIDEVFALYDLSMQDATITDTQEVDGGIQQLLELPPGDEDAGEDDEDED